MFLAQSLSFLCCENSHHLKQLKHKVMSKRILIIIAIAFLSVGLANAGESNIKTVDFTINANENLELNIDKSWTIEYGNTQHSIFIVKELTRAGEEYTVRNKFFEVRYINTPNGFGVRTVKKNQRTVHPQINEKVINEDEMKNQTLLTSSQLSEDKALQYIASFVPFLLNENYKHLLNKGF